MTWACPMTVSRSGEEDASRTGDAVRELLDVVKVVHLVLQPRFEVGSVSLACGTKVAPVRKTRALGAAV